MIPNQQQQERARRLWELHHTGKILILPNIWDPLGALLLQDLGYPAVATASASVAYSNGFNDGEHIPFDDVLKILRQIATSVAIPVTADIESGYSDSAGKLKDNTLRLLDTGIVGINVEDTDKKTGRLYQIDEQYERLRVIQKSAQDRDVPLFINARTDVLLRGNFPSAEAAYEEIVRRGRAYKDAGAGCFYPITLSDPADIGRVVAAVDMPVNLLAMPGLPDIESLEKMGVARLSLGPGFLKTALSAMKNAAQRLKNRQGLADITATDITSDYLKSLVKRN
jgi:2-methylisocitrate lyase-like PEP mutase family enzyme